MAATRRYRERRSAGAVSGSGVARTTARHRAEFFAPPTPHERALPPTSLLFQTRRGDTAALARDLAAKLGELQRTSASLDAAWRMAVVRQPASARDLWKR